MKRLLASCLGLAIVLSFAFVASAKAFDARSAENLTVAKDQVVDSTSYMSGTNLIVDGTIKGDLYCAGQYITINGTVEGDVLCTGQNVSIKGVVEGDVRVAGQVVTLEGAINGSVTLLGQTANIQQSAVIGRDATIFAQTSYIAGEVSRDATVGGEKIMITGQVGRNAELFGESIAMQGGKINGNLRYTSNKQAMFEQGATVLGSTEQQQPPRHQRPQETMVARYAAGPLYWSTAIIVIGVALLFFAPKLLKKTDHAIQVHPWRTLGVGALSLFVTPLLAVLLLLTAVGLPLAIILFALWGGSLMASLALSSYSLGRVMTSRQKSWNTRGWQKAITLAAGALVLIILAMIPIVGGLALLLALLWGLGSITLVAYQLRTTRRAKA